MAGPLQEIARQINEQPPDVLVCYGSYLSEIASFIHEGGRLATPRVVLYGADAPSAGASARLTALLGVPVLSTYQAVEALKIGFECEAGLGLHINIDLYPVRIVDEAGRDLPPGETGEVVVSNLVNRGTVLLNYRLGDRARWLDRCCPCGRSLPLLSRPEGRTSAWLVHPSGRKLHEQEVATIFTNEPEVWQYRVVQTQAQQFEIDLVVGSGCVRSELERRVLERLLATFGPGTSYSVRYVDRIPRTGHGKLVGIECRVEPLRGSDPEPGSGAHGVAPRRPGVPLRRSSPTGG
jgi:phenylacetate-CoA ligase